MKSVFHYFKRAFIEANKTIFFGRLESDVKCWTCVCQVRSTEEYPCKELSGPSFEVIENFCYLGDTLGARVWNVE